MKKLSCFLAFLLLMAGLAIAHGDNPPPDKVIPEHKMRMAQEGMGGMPGMPGLGHDWWRNSEIAQAINLSDTQKQQLNQIFASHRASLIQARGNVEIEEGKLSDLLDQDQPQQDQVLAEVTQLQNARNAKAPGTIRVGVVQINNKSDRAVSVDSLRERLTSEIQGSGIEAVSLNAISPSEAEAEAKARQCDFILYTDIATLKTSAAKKIGGMFGRAAGVGGIDKTEAKVEYRLFAVGETAARLQSAASAKEEGDEASAGTAIEQEARIVSAEVRKKRS